MTGKIPGMLFEQGNLFKKFYLSKIHIGRESFEKEKCTCLGEWVGSSEEDALTKNRKGL